MLAGSGTGCTTLNVNVYELTASPARGPLGITKSGALRRKSTVRLIGTGWYKSGKSIAVKNGVGSGLSTEIGISLTNG
jgi:hypothetical protein